ncbi:MAG: helix-turn-helix domain-containing protein [Campylobacterota bacterium]|nr:helix-turn-helix domain-containing protein [Campylobacterota bacterium]
MKFDSPKLLEKPLSKKEQKELEAEQKKKIVQTEHEFRQEKEKRLEVHFSNYANKEERNAAILQALSDGYGQAEIGRYLNITASAIAKVRNKYE